MNVIISYDIRDEKRIQKVAKYLEGVSIRLQYSVFMLINPKKDELKKIVSEVIKLIEKEDSIKVYKFNIKYAIANYDIKHFII
jgi:CRISPR-associated protein Cas2